MTCWNPPEKRTPTGLPLRAEANGKTVVVGLTERACEDLKDFEKLYIEANNHRVTAATKLNALSSRSHAILRVKLTQTTGNMVRESTASAIDLAGSEDNRRTDNDKERMVESAAINKSLFVLSQCIDAISQGAKRIPYRESKMTRILSLGQNNGITVMILNLSPLRNYHLDTLSSLNVSSRAKRIEVREIENEVVFKQVPRTNSATTNQRQPLKNLANAINTHNVSSGKTADKPAEAAKPVKAFSVYTDKAKPSGIARPRTSSGPRASSGAISGATSGATSGTTRSSSQTRRSSLKRPSDQDSTSRPSKLARPIVHQTPQRQVTQTSRPSLSSQPSEPSQPSPSQQTVTVTAAEIEAMVERKVSEILAAREAAEESLRRTQISPEAGDAVQRRLEALERRIENEEWREDAKSEGLRLLLAARHHRERGDDAAALKAYEMALPYFPNQPKLMGKIERLRARIEASGGASSPEKRERRRDRKPRRKPVSSEDDNDAEADGEEEEECQASTPKIKASKLKARAAPKTLLTEEDEDNTPNTQRLLDVVNSRDATQIQGLVGFGAKKAQDLVGYLELASTEGGGEIETLSQLRTIPGLGGRTVDRAYDGLVAKA
ncbi:uncharacterized protein TrAtP1_008159 [Trichoderma atroviride]|uniref:uncharacterized protein n=1 Tax=Hypocrea atroviridis TaxID=63577 RepID=UPI00332A9A92|nr:hypothetical protein TrAtP1_008159 [Trichoderma atroviride]